MIRKVSEVVEQLKDPQYAGYEEEILSLWAKEIINECAGNFECTMEDDMDYVGSNSDGRDHMQK